MDADFNLWMFETLKAKIQEGVQGNRNIILDSEQEIVLKTENTSIKTETESPNYDTNNINNTPKISPECLAISQILNIENKLQYVILNPRLELLKNEKFLYKRLFMRLSENMHYEVLKYLNSEELIGLRGCNLGGFQLSSNQILRKRIGNYLGNIKPFIFHLESQQVAQFIIALFEQVNSWKLISFEEMNIESIQLIYLSRAFKFLPGIAILKLRNIYIYIYIIERNLIGDEGIYELSENLKSIPNLEELYLRRVKVLSLFRREQDRK